MKILTHIRQYSDPLARRMLYLAVGILAGGTAFAAAPNLTAPGVIAGIDRSATYNLGPTGLRGWIYITTGSSELHGSNGTMTGESRQILVTVASTPASAVLAVNQDPLVKQGYRVANKTHDWEVWAKDLADGGKAVALFNLSDKDQVIGVSKSQIGLSGIVRELWRQKDVGPMGDTFSTMVSPHGVALVKIMP